MNLSDFMGGRCLWKFNSMGDGVKRNAVSPLCLLQKYLSLDPAVYKGLKIGVLPVLNHFFVETPKL